MKKNLGITEPYWSTLPEDKRLYWKYFTLAIGILSSFLISKTNIIYIDATLTVITGIFILTIIQTQRSYSKLPPKLRKTCTRIAISIGSFSITLFGIAIFSYISLASFAQVLSTEIIPVFSSNLRLETKLTMFIAFLVVFPIATIKMVRDLPIEELIYKLPHDKLKILLINKQPKSIEFRLFAFMELSILIICFIYMSSLAEIVSIYAALFES